VRAPATDRAGCPEVPYADLDPREAFSWVTQSASRPNRDERLLEAAASQNSHGLVCFALQSAVLLPDRVIDPVGLFDHDLSMIALSQSGLRGKYSKGPKSSFLSATNLP
jgi:hypothetical protein